MHGYIYKFILFIFVINEMNPMRVLIPGQIHIEGNKVKNYIIME